MDYQEVELVFISDTESEDENNELTTYSYINNGYCYEYFVGYEVAALLGYANPKNVITNNVSKCNQLVFRDYPGVKDPDLDPRTILITRDGAVEILLKTRKRITPDVLHILKTFGIETTNRKCLTKEQQCLLSITNTFKTEKFEDQYKVDCYYIDLYFPDYKILVEVDENGHKDRKPGDERERMDIVNEILGVDDNNWIRFNPDEYNFDITKVTGKIYRKIDEIKNKQLKNIDDEEKKLKKIETEIRKIYTVKINTETGEYIIPSKEILIKLTSKYTYKQIINTYNITIDDLNKWIKKYNFGIKPSQKELFEQFINKSQNQVAEYFCVDPSTIRQWLKKYNTDVTELKNKIKIFEDIDEVIKEIDNKGSRPLFSNEKICLSCKKILNTNFFFFIDKDKRIYYDNCISCCENDKKQCSKCAKIKNKTEFVSDKSKKDGLTYECKDCRNTTNRNRTKQLKEQNENIGKKKCNTCNEFKLIKMFFIVNDSEEKEYTEYCKECYCQEHGDSKQCFTCKEIKLFEFYDKKSASSDGYETYCKECRKIKRDKERSEKREQDKEKNINKKQCSNCEEFLKFNMFFKYIDNKGDIIDYYNECINCYNQDSLQCNRCHEIKDKEKCFSKDSTKKTGYRTICKKCTNN